MPGQQLWSEGHGQLKNVGQHCGEYGPKYAALNGRHSVAKPYDGGSLVLDKYSAAYPVPDHDMLYHLAIPASPKRPTTELSLPENLNTAAPVASVAATFLTSGPPVLPQQSFPSVSSAYATPSYALPTTQSHYQSNPTPFSAPDFSTGRGGQWVQGPSPANPPFDIGVSPQSARGSRKTKTHVASACVNCKRAHLSCDVQRPCGRCVTSGKQETCVDVAHKKRGRPRLRDDGEFKMERPLPAPLAATSSAVDTGMTQVRPMATPRHRRQESFRSMQSLTSEGSPSYGPPTPSYLRQPDRPYQSALTYVSPRSSAPSNLASEVPTALLDMNLVIMRANRAFQQIMAAGRELTQQRLTDIAAPADSESFISIRDSLREERDGREPSYLPPILPSGETPISGVDDRDVERYTEGYRDRTHTWLQLQAAPGAAQTFPARIRLAKAATYFIVVILPSFRPVADRPPPQQGSMYGPHLAFSPGPSVQQPRPVTPQQRPPSVHPAPSYTYRPEDSRTYPPQQQQQQQSYQQSPSGSSSFTYPPAQQPSAYQRGPYASWLPPQQQQSHPPQLRSHLSEPMQHYPRYTAMAAPSAFGPMLNRESQPPTLASSPMPITPASAEQYGGATGVSDVMEGRDNGSSDEEADRSDGARTSKKRRTMGIDEVLQR
ncbi:hypothetical protein B0A48_14052 [Cryoendolithus antarcticus]|uniref:Zn(2)-C6 fungal-type domain-containing protein n=1 Tax=Cryoendolithus antarcticus TaxID=1507870 RepID=A0A1V8SM75_9PEZI|nr:hypothetical protein B0A48_14052 [Cryoendolithus antarcticus]